eukprot:m.61354 g.61354  ORF g.61354 m.61354 type:complete len:499 (-) comp11402_c0_seq1:1299-2795(-)
MSVPLVKARLRKENDKCTFSNSEIDIEIGRGELLWLQGASGAGKTLCSLHLLGIQKAPGVSAEVEWDPSVQASERCGMLFQQGVLIDSLTVSENIALSLMSAGLEASSSAIKASLEKVGLRLTDRHKMPNELSGGMLRRAALAQLLAQRKRLIVLDEPFIGLDKNSASGIVSELQELKKTGTSFLLISHQKHYADLLHPDKCIEVFARDEIAGPNQERTSHGAFSMRTMIKMMDYFGYSLPLIMLAFVAAGFAISMLFADVLQRTDIKDTVIQVFDEEMENAPAGPFQAFIPLLKDKILEVIDDRAPEFKAMLYCHGLAKLFVLELGPLVTALLLAGRIGGSYAGEVGTMQATNQNRLLVNLGVSPRTWSLLPSVIAALLAAPLLTAIGTYVALLCGAYVVTWYDLGEVGDYWLDVEDATFSNEKVVWQTYPPFVLAYRSFCFMLIIMTIAEVCARWNPLLQPRNVPTVITSAVVLSGLLIIFADWGFSQVLLKYANW